MAVTQVVSFLHIISVRTELVRSECYYILCFKASEVLDVAAEQYAGCNINAAIVHGQRGNEAPERGTLAHRICVQPQRNYAALCCEP